MAPGSEQRQLGLRDLEIRLRLPHGHLGVDLIQTHQDFSRRDDVSLFDQHLDHLSRGLESQGAPVGRFDQPLGHYNILLFLQHCGRISGRLRARFQTHAASCQQQYP